MPSSFQLRVWDLGHVLLLCGVRCNVHLATLECHKGAHYGFLVQDDGLQASSVTLTAGSMKAPGYASKGLIQRAFCFLLVALEHGLWTGFWLDILGMYMDPRSYACC